LGSFQEEAGQRDDPRTWHAVAGVYAELGRLDSAETAIQKSIALDGAYAPAWLSRSRYAEQSGRPEQALDYVTRAFGIDSTDTNTWLVLARLENQVGDPSRAIHRMQELLRVDPWSYTAIFELGRSYQKLDQTKTSAQLFERSNQLREVMQPVELLENTVLSDPSNFANRVRLADANRQIQRYDHAVRQYQAALILRPENLDLASNLGTLYLQMGKKSDAIDLFRSVLNKDPQHLATLLNVALLRIEEGDFRQSRIFFDKASAINPDHPLLVRIQQILEENGA